MARRPPMGAGTPPARVPARQPGQSGQDGAQVRTTALVAGCKRASPSRCVLRSVTHLWTGFVTHVDVLQGRLFTARGQSAPRPARRDDLRERKSPRCSRASNVVSNAEVSILQTRKTPRPTSTALNCRAINLLFIKRPETLPMSNRARRTRARHIWRLETREYCIPDETGGPQLVLTSDVQAPHSAKKPRAPERSVLGLSPALPLIILDARHGGACT